MQRVRTLAEYHFMIWLNLADMHFDSKIICAG
jgi:hypothetical protein